MLRILIVDDEPFFLDFLSGFIDWKSHGAELRGTAKNGRQAMQFLEKNTADVVITDIKMPVMDGLELIRDALEVNPSLQFVVLSSYSDFPMVQEAFKLGVKEYALKPEITREQLVKILENCTERQTQQRLAQEKIEEQNIVYKILSNKVAHLERMFRDNLLIVRNTFFNAAIDRDEPVETLPEYHQAAQFRLTDPPTALLLIVVDDYGRIIRDAWERDERMFEYAVFNILEEMAETHGSMLVFSRKPGRYIVLFGARNSLHETRRIVHDYARAARENLKQYLKLDVILSASALDAPSEGFGVMYRQARDANRRFFLVGKDRLLVYKESDADGGPEDNRNALVQSFRQNLLTKNISYLQGALSQYQMESAAFGQVEELKRLFQRYAFYLSEYIEQNDCGERAAQLMGMYEDTLARYGTLGDLNEWLEKIITVLLQMEYGSTNLIRRVKKHILAHYPEELNLTVLAEAMGVNPSYLSRSFSKVEGDSLISYINSIRVQAAIHLMQDTGLKLYEIADQVGYKNVEHFSRVFRKIVGKTPRDYLGS